MKYLDKNGKTIVEGMTLQHDDGEELLVYKADDGDLGFNASNEQHSNFSELNRQVYPLFQFNLKEWEIVRGK